MRRSLIALVLAALTLPLPALASNDPGFSLQWGLEKIGAESAWAKGTGQGVVIAIVDTGVDIEHEDLKGKLVDSSLWKDFVDGGTPDDENGHGTHVAGIAAATTSNGLGVAGTAPGARILPVRVLDENGASTGSVSQGITWAVDKGADVINLSLSTVGQQVFGASFADALEYAWARGAIPVVAAGNEYLLSSGYEDDPALVVSATNRNDGKPDFSSGVGEAQWGISAPGGGSTFDPIENDIFSTYVPNEYAYNAGTSMSAPHVSGAVAILRGLGLDPQKAVDRILETAKDVGQTGDDSVFGHGRLDLAAATSGFGGASGGGAGGGGGGGTSPGPSPKRTPTTGGSKGSSAPTALPASPDSPPEATPNPPPVSNEPGAAPPASDAGSPAGLIVVAVLVALGGAGALIRLRFKRG